MKHSASRAKCHAGLGRSGSGRVERRVCAQHGRELMGHERRAKGRDVKRRRCGGRLEVQDSNGWMRWLHGPSPRPCALNPEAGTR